MTAPRIAYLTGQYPLVSLTFIQREIEALRALGVDIHTVAARQTPPEQHKGREGQEAAATTHYLLREARNPLTLLKAQVEALRSSPARYGRALALAMRMRTPGLKSFFYQLIYFVEATLMAQYARANNIEHIHSHFVTSGTTVAVLTSELTGLPYSFTLHGPADLFEQHRWSLNIKTARAKFVATISDFARSQLMFFSDPEHWHKIRIIHCGVDPDRYDAPSPARDASDTRVNLIFVGRLAPVKGLRVLIDTMKALAPKLPNLHLTIIGDGPDRKQLESQADSIKDRVTFTGYQTQTEVSAAFRANDVCVLPSFAEGVPVVLMEAMASRKPVIATQVAGVGELVEDGISGFIVPPGNAQALSEKIEFIYKNTKSIADFGAAGRARVVEDFHIQKEAQRLLSLFTDTAGEAPRPPLG